VVIVALDEEARQVAWGSWPLPRGALAALVDAVKGAGAKAIAIDLLLKDTAEASLQDENLALEAAIRGAGNVVLGVDIGAADGESRKRTARAWAARLGSFKDEDEAAAALLESGFGGLGAWPIGLPGSGRVELWLADYATREDAEAVGRVPGLAAFHPPFVVRELTPTERQAGDLLSAVVRRRHALVAGGEGLGERFQMAIPQARFALAAARLGGVSQGVVGQGMVLALRHVYPTEDGDYLSLALAAVSVARGEPAIAVRPGELRFGATRAPLDPDARLWIRWYGPHDGAERFESTFPVISAGAILHALEKNEPVPGAKQLEGKIAILCPTLSAGKDVRASPVNPHAVGGEIVANAIDNLLRGEFVRRSSRGLDALLALVICLALGLFSASVPARARGAVLAMVGLAAIVGGYYFSTTWLIGHGIWLPFAVPAIAGILTVALCFLANTVIEGNEKRFVHDALGRYTSPALVDKLIHDRGLLDRFGGARAPLSVYFSDIRGFTTISESMDADRLVELLNAYLSALSEIIEEGGGYIDKYIGDAIMAVWGAPVPREDHAAAACETALRMKQKLEELRPVWKERFGVELHARAGVNSGLIVFGNVGSSRKTQATVLGDAVNLASRLEGANKVYGTEILVGEETYEQARGRVEARSVDVVRVKGKTQGVTIYELLAPRGALPEAAQDWLARWETAMSLYRARRFAEARDAFAALRAEKPGDPVAALYVERCQGYLATPPPDGWDGVHEMHEK
jgi:adenylate cyclase